jgi:hypothetical protein
VLLQRGIIMALQLRHEGGLQLHNLGSPVALIYRPQHSFSSID